MPLPERRPGRGRGKIEFEGSVGEAVNEEGFGVVAMTMAHADAIASLPTHHRDPFDRLLVAQARTEGLTLATLDPQIRAYSGFEALPKR